MKLIALALLFVGLSTNAHAYLSASGNDPSAGSYDAETKVAVKSETALYSDAITKGHALYYSENELTGLYKVSRFYSGNGFAVANVPFQACVAARDVATGDVAGFPCVVRGYVDYGIYDATSAITVGGYLCVGTAATVKGKFIACGSGVISKFIALESKASGTGSNLKVRVLSE